jgi:5-methylcytosine-specific restriction endonuclease McrA
MMSKRDFVTFGVKLNDRLQLRASKALGELNAFGDLELRSAWLYYGSQATASAAFGVSISTYRKAIERRERYLRWKLRTVMQISEDELDLIMDGSQMIMGLSKAERETLFPPNAQPTVTKGKYTAKVESWRRLQSEPRLPGHSFTSLPVPTAVELIQSYVKGNQILLKDYEADAESWQVKRLIWRFFEVHLHRPLKRAIAIRDRIEYEARVSKLCAVAMDIIREYETYCSLRSELRRHIQTQRKIIDSRRDEFLDALGTRDGSLCRACGLVEDLRIDHKVPLSLGSFSILENLQLLCSFCNGSKGERLNCTD